MSEPEKGGRRRRFDDNLCIECRVRPRGIRNRDGKTLTDSYCRRCRLVNRRKSYQKNRIKGHEGYAWLKQAPHSWVNANRKAAS